MEISSIKGAAALVEPADSDSDSSLSESEATAEAGKASSDPDETASSTHPSDLSTTSSRCQIECAEDVDPSLSSYLVRRLRQVTQHCGIRQCQLTVTVVDDDQMCRLHEQFKGQRCTTDVLTFDLGEGGMLEGDIVVCLDEAVRQARDRGHEARDEVLLYALHGLLHLLGDDDHDASGAAAMHASEDALLSAIGVGPIFHREARST